MHNTGYYICSKFVIPRISNMTGHRYDGFKTDGCHGYSLLTPIQPGTFASGGPPQSSANLYITLGSILNNINDIFQLFKFKKSKLFLIKISVEIWNTINEVASCTSPTFTLLSFFLFSDFTLLELKFTAKDFKFSSHKPNASSKVVDLVISKVFSLTSKLIFSVEVGFKQMLTTTIF